MAIYFGNDKIKDIYVGSDKIKEVYYGSEKVWPIKDGYWVHKNTGVKTYFWLEELTIISGIMYSPSWYRDCSEVKLPSGVTSLGGNCFSNCSSLTSITLPEGVTSLGYGCFSECTSLTSITLPESLTSIELQCFLGCSSLTSITLPESVTSLGYMCFAFCTSLTSITLPESVTSIGNDCFMVCTSLILATVLPAIPPTLGSGAFNNVHYSFKIKVYSPYVNAYKTTGGWYAYAAKISAI